MHISTSDLAGGASLAAYRIHKLMMRSDIVTSDMLVLNKTSIDHTIRELGGMRRLQIKLRSKLSRLRIRLTHGNRFGYMSSHNCGERIMGLPLTKHEIVHMHWVQGGFVKPSSLQGLETPVVWTLHDMWPILGLRHYGGGESSAKLEIDEDKAVEDMISCKPQKLVFHCTTNWMADKVRKSKWGNTGSIEVVPYPVSDVYLKHSGHSQFRKDLGARDGDVILLFGAINATSDARKGFDLAVEALTMLPKSQQSVKVVLFGCEEIDEKARQKIEVFCPVCTGYVSSESRLADIYAAADIMLVPSRIEAFGQTAIEAQACGVPTICFSETGVSELIEHGVTGFVIPAFDTAEMAKRISQLIEDPEYLGQMQFAARDRARRLWAPDVVLSSMESLYYRALELCGES